MVAIVFQVGFCFLAAYDRGPKFHVYCIIIVSTV